MLCVSYNRFQVYIGVKKYISLIIKPLICTCLMIFISLIHTNNHDHAHIPEHQRRKRDQTERGRNSISLPNDVRCANNYNLNNNKLFHY